MLSMLYFAYGSNMNPLQMNARMGNLGACKVIGSATLIDYRLVFDVPDDHAVGAGYANVRKKKGSVVHGVLYEIDKIGLDLLDKYECTPVLYDRKSIYVLYKNKKLKCFIYLGKKRSKGLCPTTRYLNRLLKAKDFLPEDYYQALLCLKICKDPKFDKFFKISKK